jgi:hypothetical protein
MKWFIARRWLGALDGYNIDNKCLIQILWSGGGVFKHHGVFLIRRKPGYGSMLLLLLTFFAIPVEGFYNMNLLGGASAPISAIPSTGAGSATWSQNPSGADAFGNPLPTTVIERVGDEDSANTNVFWGRYSSDAVLIADFGKVQKIRKIDMEASVYRGSGGTWTVEGSDWTVIWTPTQTTSCNGTCPGSAVTADCNNGGRISTTLSAPVSYRYYRAHIAGMSSCAAPYGPAAAISTFQLYK